jgi:tetrahydromethanopterin S-methyltransferase subunit H
MKYSGTPEIVASMFYEGDSLILDAEQGRIDEAGAANRIKKTNNMSKKYKVPFVLDIEIPTVASASAIISAVAHNTESSFWISSFNSEMRIKAAEVAVKDGFKDRIYYSTLNYMSDEDEFRAVADLGIKPVIQIFNPDNPLPDGYLAKADEFISLAAKLNMPVKDIVLLPTILDFGGISIVMSVIPSLKQKYSLPICMPSVGPVYKWAEQYTPDARRLLLASTITHTLASGAEQVHIGSIKRSFIAFPVVSFFDTLEKRKASFEAE